MKTAVGCLVALLVAGCGGSDDGGGSPGTGGGSSGGGGSSSGGYTSGGAFVDGMTPAVWIGAGVVAAGSVAAFLIRRTPKAAEVASFEPALENAA